MILTPPTTQFEDPPSEKIAGSFQQSGKKKRGSGGNEFLPACCSPKAYRGGKRFRNSALAEYQNRKIFVSLIEKNFAGGRGGAIERMFRKCFCFASAFGGGGQKRWAGLSFCGRQSKVSIRIFFKESSNFAQNPNFENWWPQRDSNPCLRVIV